MGYDMYIEDQTGLNENTGYFHLNITGMSEFRNAMEQLGLLTWRVNQVEWPELSEAVKNALYHKLEDEWTPEEAAAIAEHRSVTDSDTGGVMPGYKFCSNDGWLVTSGEIRSALAAYQRHSKQTAKELVEAVIDWSDAWKYWQKWIRFLARAEDRGGFRVW